MGDSNMKEVDFSKYCETCKYGELEEKYDPCNDCLDICVREGTEKPECYEEAEAKKTSKKKKAKKP